MGVRVTVEIGAVTLRNKELDRLEVRHALDEHGVLTVRFTRDQASSVTLPDLLGAPAAVTLTDDRGVSETVFRGQVTAASQRHLANFGSAFEVEARTPSWRLEYRRTAYYPKHTLGEIADALGATIADPAPDSQALDYAQVEESDFDFLVRSAVDHGCFVRTAGEQPEICTEFQDTGLELTFGYELLEVTGRCEVVNHGIKGAAYQVDGKRDHQFHGIAVTPAWLSGAPTLVDKVTKLAPSAAGGGDANVLDSPSRSPTLAAASRALQRESERRLAEAVVVEALSVAIGVGVGELVTLNDSERSALLTTGTFGVTEVVHRLEEQQYVNTFSATPAPRFASRSRPKSHRIRGLVTAEVVDNVDPETVGRIKVRYRWQARSEDDPTLRTHWVRVVTPYAGRDRGVAFLPEVGDEVVLGFERGDPERPFMLGSAWNGVDVAPDTAGVGEDNGVKQIVTRSGNTIRFVEEAGSEVVELFSANGRCVLQLKNDDEGTHTLTIRSEGDIALEAPNGEIRLACQTLIHRVNGSAYHAAANDYANIRESLIHRAGSVLSIQSRGDTEVVAGGDVKIKAATVTNQPGMTEAKLPSQSEVPPDPGSLCEGRDFPPPEQETEGTSTADEPTPRQATASRESDA
jgi:type VI secretion system secreted protein VgrG